MRGLIFFLVGYFLLLCGCQTQEQQKLDFELSYLLIDANNSTTQGIFTDSISFPRNSTYFHIRTNITSRYEEVHYLRVLDQSYDVYSMRLPLYSEEKINGINRKWTDITGLEGGVESLVPLEPQKTKQLEQPIFFFNQMTSPTTPKRIELELYIINATGTVLGSKTVLITLTDN